MFRILASSGIRRFVQTAVSVARFKSQGYLQGMEYGVDFFQVGQEVCGELSGVDEMYGTLDSIGIAVRQSDTEFILLKTEIQI